MKWSDGGACDAPMPVSGREGFLAIGGFRGAPRRVAEAGTRVECSTRRWVAALGVAGGLFFGAGICHAAGWPRILGPAENATSPETGLLHELPKVGPRVLWEAGKGNGFGGPAVVGDRAVIFYRAEGKEIVDCLAVETGKMFWHFDYVAPYRSRYGGSEGPRTSPVIADGRVFTFGIGGLLHCLDLASGAVVWERDLAKEYKMGPAFFGYGSTPLVLGQKLIVQIGGEVNGKAANTVALDAKNGKLLWAANHAWGPSYASSVVAKLHGRECVLVFAGGESRPPTGGLLLIDAADGKVFGTAEQRADIAESVNAASPVVLTNEPGKPPRVFIGEAYGSGGAAYDIAPDFSVKRAWAAPQFDLYWMTPLVRDGAVIGFSGQSERLAELVAHDIATGKELWRSDLGGGFGRGSLVGVDGGVLCLGEFGDLAWLELSRTGVAVKSRAKLFNAPETWTPPSISGGRLFICQNEPGAGGTKPRLICCAFRKP